VLLDQRLRREGKGSKLVAVAPAAETIKAVHDVVAGITGFVQERGDQIIIESLPFEATLDQQEASEPSAAPALPASKLKPTTWKDKLKDPKMLAAIGGGVLLLVAAVLLFLRKRKKSVSDPAIAKTLAAGNAARSLSGEPDAMTELEKKVAEQTKSDMAAIAALKLPTIVTKKGDLLTKEIVENAKKDPSIPAHVLQTWLHEND
jgi:flagellar M-ring protein FliF